MKIEFIKTHCYGDMIRVMLKIDGQLTFIFGYQHEEYNGLWGKNFFHEYLCEEDLKHILIGCNVKNKKLS